MSSKQKNMTPVQQEYQTLAKTHETKRPIIKNCVKAFFVGGFICFIGQFISLFIQPTLTLQNDHQAIQLLRLLFLYRCY